MMNDEWSLFCRLWVRLASRRHRELAHQRNCSDGCHVSCGIDPDKPRTPAYWQSYDEDEDL